MQSCAQVLMLFSLDVFTGDKRRMLGMLKAWK